jgi:thioredoxin reductase (NADPH)
LVLEKGCLADSIYRFPPNLIFFSTPDLLEIGGIPFIIASEKPTRTDILEYYRRVTEHHHLNIKLYEPVTSVSGTKPEFLVETSSSRYTASHIIVATGQYDTPNRLEVPGEDLETVSHYYTEPHPYYGRKVVIIGGKNSAVEAALDLYRHGADVTIVHRGNTFGKSVKYWIRPDIENRVKEGGIKAFFNTVVEEFLADGLIVRNGTGGERKLDCDFVFALTGYKPDRDFLEKMSISIGEGLRPRHNPETLETNVPGIYVAGVITAGSESSEVFIENSRHHGTKIVGHIVNGSR